MSISKLCLLYQSHSIFLGLASCFLLSVVQDGALPPVLALCGMSVSEAIALIAVRTLNLLMENIGSHTALIEVKITVDVLHFQEVAKFN